MTDEQRFAPFSDELKLIIAGNIEAAMRDLVLAGNKKTHSANVSMKMDNGKSHILRGEWKIEISYRGDIDE